jgi:hypothetical protein
MPVAEPLAPSGRHDGARAGRDHRGAGAEALSGPPSACRPARSRGMGHEMGVPPVRHAVEDARRPVVAQRCASRPARARVGPQARGPGRCPAPRRRGGGESRGPIAGSALDGMQATRAQTGAVGTGIEHAVAVGHLRDLGARRKPAVPAPMMATSSDGGGGHRGSASWPGRIPSCRSGARCWPAGRCRFRRSAPPVRPCRAAADRRSCRPRRCCGGSRSGDCRSR